MRLTDYTDYTLRVLMFCALHPERSVTIAELADSHAVSKNHLMKIVNDLARQGLLQTTRGRGGGLRLLKPADEIRIGDVVRQTESDVRLVECFDKAHDTCPLTPNCQLKAVFGSALQSDHETLISSTTRSFWALAITWAAVWISVKMRNSSTKPGPDKTRFASTGP